MTTDDGVTVWERPEPKRRKGDRPAPRPLDALDSQVGLIEALHGPRGADLVVAMVETSNAEATGNLIEIRREHEQRAARQLADTLNTATTVVVTERMLDFVLDRMPSIPFGDPLTPDDLLFEAAYIVLPRRVSIGELGDDDRDNFPPRKLAEFDAGFYVPQQVAAARAIRGPDGETADLFSDGIMYVQSVSHSVFEDYIAELRADPERTDFDADEMERSLNGIRELKIKHAPVYASGIGFGLSWDPELREEDFILTDAGEFERRFWLSLFRTLKEEVFAPVRFRRADQRRAMRRGLIPDVVVADLRRVKHAAKEERLVTGETIMWSHRWIRRGHTRTLNRGTDKEKTVWVREHVCGPQSMPLIHKDRVYRLSK